MPRYSPIPRFSLLEAERRAGVKDYEVTLKELNVLGCYGVKFLGYNAVKTKQKSKRNNVLAAKKQEFLGDNAVKTKQKSKWHNVLAAKKWNSSGGTQSTLGSKAGSITGRLLRRGIPWVERSQGL
jgi:hypothetical protein